VKVLVCGASGFIGRHLGRRLLRSGHTVVAVMRHASNGPVGDFASHAVTGDFSRDVSAADWLPRLAGVDVVVNAVGILRERGEQRFERLHVRGPIALFDACVQAGVPRVVQISALGADEQAQSAFHLSKRMADQHLLSLPLAGTVVQPSLVYGPGGASAALFTLLASLPLIPVPGRGEQPVQPVHVDDMVQALQALIERETDVGQSLPLVGPHPLALRELIARLRAGMRLPPPRWLEVPLPLVRVTAAVADRVPGVPFDRQTLQMLERGNTAPAESTQRLLGRPARAVESFIEREHATSARVQGLLAWLLPLLRLSIALVWIVTGLLSFGLYPVQDSYALLARLGITGALAPVMLYGAAALDLALGVATLVLRRRVLLWWTQIALMLGYMGLITWALPEFWLHPFGPILKNLPMLAAVALLLALEEPRWNT
jgi:uncharacterized protein YbjT (DUF2867 family)